MGLKPTLGPITHGVLDGHQGVGLDAISVCRVIEVDKQHIAQTCLAALRMDGEVVDIEHLGLAHGGGLEIGAVQMEWFIARERDRDQIAHELTLEPGPKAGLGAGCNLDGEAVGRFQVVPGIGQLLKFKNVINIRRNKGPNDKCWCARNTTEG